MAAWQDETFAADIEVMNDAGVALAVGAWTYRVVCAGNEGNSAGPERTRLSASRSTRSKVITFLVLGTKRVLTSYRICRYDSVSGRYRGCDRERLTARNRTKDGFRVQFYDRDLKQRLSLFRGTRPDC